MSCSKDTTIGHIQHLFSHPPHEWEMWAGLAEAAAAGLAM